MNAAYQRFCYERTFFLISLPKLSIITFTMKLRFFIIIFLFVSSIGFAETSLKSRLIQAKSGDFIVTSQNGIYSLLLIRYVEQNKLLLEEITIEQELVDLPKVSWKNWVEKKAPGASSWTAYVIDLDKNTLTQCYNHFLKQWIFLEKSDYYFAQLLTLPLRPLKDSERKRIGPAPMPGEIDRRKFWKPQLTREGKKVARTEFEVVRCSWPSDKTRLAGCTFEIYLDAEDTTFPFPYWMEVQSSHYSFKIRTVDSGSGMQSPMPLLH